MYPRGRHHPEKGSVIVHSMEEDDALGDGWCSSPAEFGVETCPGERPDKKIAANKRKKPTPKAPEKTPEGTKE